VGAVGVGLGRRITHRISLGGVHETLVHGDEGYVMVYPVGESAVLVMCAPQTCNLGLMRLEAREACAVLEPLLG
jgi:uncharacterized protein